MQPAIQEPIPCRRHDHRLDPITPPADWTSSRSATPVDVWLGAHVARHEVRTCASHAPRSCAGFGPARLDADHGVFLAAAAPSRARLGTASNKAKPKALP